MIVRPPLSVDFEVDASYALRDLQRSPTLFPDQRVEKVKKPGLITSFLSVLDVMIRYIVPEPISGEKD